MPWNSFIKSETKNKTNTNEKTGTFFFVHSILYLCCLGSKMFTSIAQPLNYIIDNWSLLIEYYCLGLRLEVINSFGGSRNRWNIIENLQLKREGNRIYMEWGKTQHFFFVCNNTLIYGHRESITNMKLESKNYKIFANWSSSL